MSAPAVSVLMPVLNPHRVYFPAAVQSIIDQTFTDWELVIVEDPSAASAADLLTTFSDPRIVHIRNTARTSFADQLNLGLEKCRAEWVARMDADDIAEPTRLAEQMAFHATHPEVDVFGSQLTIIDAGGKVVGERRYPQSHQEILNHFRRYNALPHPAVMFRRELIRQAGGYQFTFPLEDYDLWSRLALGGVRFANHPEPLLRYRMTDGASKWTHLKATLRKTREVKRRYWLGSMTVADRLRYLAELALLGLPSRWVYGLFQMTQTKQSRQPRSA